MTRKSLADREWLISDAFNSIVNILAWPFYAMFAMALCTIILSFVVSKTLDNPDQLLGGFYLLFSRLYVYAGVVMFAMGLAAAYIVRFEVGADASNAYVEKYGDRDFYEEYFSNSIVTFTVFSLLTMGALLVGHGYSMGVITIANVPVSIIGVAVVFGVVMTMWPALKAFRAWVLMAGFLLEDFAAPIIATWWKKYRNVPDSVTEINLQVT